LAIRTPAQDTDGCAQGIDGFGLQSHGQQGQAFVYVIGSEDGPQKIGMSANPASRLRGLQTSSPHRLKLLAAVDVPATDAVAVERHAHAALSLHHLLGEWFRVTPDQAVTAVQEAAAAVALEQAKRAAAAKRQGEQQFLFPADLTRSEPLTVQQLAPSQCRMARAALGWTTRDLAERAQVGVMTISRLEAGTGDTYPATRAAIARALEAGGVSFIPENGEGAGVRLRKPDP